MLENYVLVGLTALITALGGLLVTYIRKIEKVDKISSLETKLESLVERVSELIDHVNMIIEKDHEIDKRLTRTEDWVDRIRERSHKLSNEVQDIKGKQELLEQRVLDGK